MKSGLLIIDMQNDYFPGGAMALSGMDMAGDNAARVLAEFRRRGEAIFHIQHLSTREGATFFLPDTPGCEIAECVRPAEGEVVITKNFPSSFQQTGLAGALEEAGVGDLVICGAMSHMCVDTTVRSAFERGLTSTVIHDACATCDLSFAGELVPAATVHAAYMAALGQVFSRMMSTEEYLSSL